MRGGSASPTETDTRTSDDDNHSYYSHYSDGSMGLAKKKSKKLSLVSYIPMTDEEGTEDRCDSAHFRLLESQSGLQMNPRRDPPTTTKQHGNSFDHSSSTHKARGGGGGKSSRRRPAMSVIRDDEEMPDYNEDPGMGRPVAENLADVNPTTLDPLSHDALGGVDAAETRSRRRDRLSRLSRVRSPPRQSNPSDPVSSNGNEETRAGSLSPTKRNHNRPSALKSPKYTLSPDSMTPQTADPVSPQRKMNQQTHSTRTGNFENPRDFRDERRYAGQTMSPTMDDSTSPQKASYQQVQYQRTNKVEYSRHRQEERRYDCNPVSPQNGMKHDPQEEFTNRRQVDHKSQEYKPELTMPSLPGHHVGQQVPRERQYRHETSRTSYASDTSSVVTSSFQHGVPCVSTSHMYGQYPADNHGKGWTDNCSSFVSGVWESCSNITRYQTESKRNLLQLEMIAEQSLSSIYQSHGRTSPDAFRHTRDLLDKAKKEKQEANSRQLTAVTSDETIADYPMKNNFGMKAISTLREAVGFNDDQTNEPQSIMDDMRNLFDSFSTYYAPHHQPYDGGVDTSSHGVYHYRHGNTAGTPFDLNDDTLHSDEASEYEPSLGEHDDNDNDEEKKELSEEAARTSIYHSVIGATRDRRSMVMELQKRRMKQVNKKKEETWDAPRKVEDETAKLRMVYLGLYDKIHEEKRETNNQEVDGRDDAQNTVVTAETADDEREYNVVWAASECSLDSPQHPMAEPEEENDEEFINEVEPKPDVEDLVEEQSPDEVRVETQECTPTREQVDAPASLPKQPTRTVDSDETDMFSATGTDFREEPDPVMTSNEENIPILKSSGSKDGDKSLHTVHTTATTTTSEMDDLVHSFLATEGTPTANTSNTTHSKAMVNEEDDQWSVHSDPTLADSSIMSGFSGSRQTQDTSMADSILSNSQSGTNSSGRQLHDHFCDDAEIQPDSDEHAESISEYQVLYQISEEDEEEVSCEDEDDASFEPMNDVPFDEDVTMEDYNKKQDGKKPNKGKRFLQWVLVVCLAYYLELIDLTFVHLGIYEPIVTFPAAMESAPQEALSHDMVREGEVESKQESPVSSKPKIVIESPASLTELFPEHDLLGESAPGNEMYRNAWGDELREALEVDEHN